MKKLLYIILPAFLLAATSCSDSVNTEESNEDFKFQKELTIHDSNGNSADLIIYANSEEILADQTDEVIYLKTSTETLTNTKNIETNSTVEDINENPEEIDVFIFVSNYNLNPDVKSFSVRSKLEYNSNEISTRASDTKYHCAFGADGVTGAFVRYVSQTCNKEYIRIKLRTRNSSGGSWSILATGKLRRPNDTWEHETGTQFHEYQLELTNKYGCSGTALYSFFWLT